MCQYNHECFCCKGNATCGHPPDTRPLGARFLGFVRDMNERHPGWARDLVVALFTKTQKKGSRKNNR